jgi:hypothetical protein
MTMRRPLLFTALVGLVALAVFAQVRWNQYPTVTAPEATDTFLIGTSTTNQQITAADVLLWLGTNVTPRWANLLGIPNDVTNAPHSWTNLSDIPAGFADGTDDGGGGGVDAETVTNIVNGMTLPATNAFGNPDQAMTTDASRFGGLTNIQAHALGWALSNPDGATNHVLSLTNAMIRAIEATNDVHLLFADAAPGRGVSVDILASGGIRNFSSPTNGHWLVTTNLFTVTGTNYTLAIPAGKVLTVSARQNFAGAASSNLVVAAKLEGDQ